MSTKAGYSTLVVIMISVLFVALIATAGVIFYFAGPKSYHLKDLLIAPSNLKNVQLEFLLVENEQWHTSMPSKEAYTLFYKRYAMNRSLPVVNDTIVEQFMLSKPSSLTLVSEERHLFQQIDFLGNSSIFRVMVLPHLRGKTEEGWIYFSEIGIYDEAKEIFTAK